MPTTPPKIEIMIVDDHAVIREGLEWLIRDKLSFTIHSCTSSHAIALLTMEANISIIITDFLMPSLTGFELIKELAHFPSRPFAVIMLTMLGGYTQEFIETCKSAGPHVFPVDYIEKSCIQHELLTSIQAAIDQIESSTSDRLLNPVPTFEVE